MQLPPQSVFDSWPAPNSVNPETRGSSATITVSVLLGVVTLLLLVRIYTRVHISRGFGLDDVFILMAYLPTAAFGVLSIVAQYKVGWGKHIWDVPFTLFEPGLQISLASQLLFALATTLTKLSMLALIYRVVSVDRSRYRYVVLAVACVVALDGFIFFLVATFQCSPISAYWTLSSTPQKCINEAAHLLAAGCINTSTDFIIVLIPIPYVTRLKLPRKQQIIIGSLFAGGIFVTAAGAVRTFVMFKLYEDFSKDMTWNSIPIIITSALELYIGIICASIPPIKPFFARYLPMLIGNPKWWPSQQMDSQQRAASYSSKFKNVDDNFWLVTAADIDDGGELSPTSTSRRPSTPLVMQMQTAPLMPGMPTPTRPPRTQSTYRSIPSIYRPTTSSSTQTFAVAPSVAPSTYTTYSNATTIAASEAALARKASLNKPLPRIPSATRRDWLGLAEEDNNNNHHTRSRSSMKNITSVYQFVPHKDGSISVVRTKGDDDSLG